MRWQPFLLGWLLDPLLAGLRARISIAGGDVLIIRDVARAGAPHLVEGARGRPYGSRRNGLHQSCDGRRTEGSSYGGSKGDEQWWLLGRLDSRLTEETSVRACDALMGRGRSLQAVSILPRPVTQEAGRVESKKRPGG